MTHKNNILAATITAILALTASVEGYAGQFQNVIANLPVFDPFAPNLAMKLYPKPEFDFVGQTYLPALSLTEGTPFATELFSNGTLILPTPGTETKTDPHRFFHRQGSS